MSKEEILEGKNGFFYLEDFVYHEIGVKEAMDEYAKQEAIAFNNFVWNGYREILHGLKITPLYVTKEDFYKLENPSLGKKYTQEELYNEYLKSKT